MTSLLLTVLELGDYLIIAVIVTGFAGGASFAGSQRLDVRRLERKLKALLQHHGVSVPSRSPPEVQHLAKDQARALQAVQLHREQNLSLDFAEAKTVVEEFG
jgi:hypothetical protein